jgi:multidrug efflux system membrane fusion protein
MIRVSLCLALVAAACGDPSSQAAGPRGGGGTGGPPKGGIKFPVEVAKVEARRVEYTVTAVGTIDAFEKVQVTARVPGAVDRVLFSEGDIVKEGQPLAEIEPRRYQVAVQQAKAAIAKAQSAVADARAGLARRETAVAANPGLITGEEIDTFRTRARAGEADVAAAKAALDLAELNLRDAYVRAPASGIIDTRTVQTGQYLQAGTVLATLVRREPLLLRFQVSEPEAKQLRIGTAAHFRVRSDEEADREAKITHISGEANQASRMVAVTAAIDNQTAKVLRPGAFAEVSVPIGGSDDAPVIPQMAVRASERGFLAYIVDGDVAHERVLTLGLRTNDGRVEVRAGLKPGEMLVVRGAESLREGAGVRIAGPEQKPKQEARQ